MFRPAFRCVQHPKAGWNTQQVRSQNPVHRSIWEWAHYTGCTVGLWHIQICSCIMFVFPFLQLVLEPFILYNRWNSKLKRWMLLRRRCKPWSLRRTMPWTGLMPVNNRLRMPTSEPKGYVPRFWGMDKFNGDRGQSHKSFHTLRQLYKCMSPVS